MKVAVAEPSAAEREFATMLATDLATFEPEDLSGDSLALQFTLSAYMRSCQIGLYDAEVALGSLRLGLMSASGLSWDEEPTPLLFAARKSRLINLCHYVYGLLARAAAHSGLERSAMVEQAIGAWSQLSVAG